MNLSGMCYQLPSAQSPLNDSSYSPNVFFNIDSGQLRLFNQPVGLHIYVPDDYNNNLKRYPVLYLLNGDSAFNYNLESDWYIDETMDSLLKQPQIMSSLVVAINNLPYVDNEEDSIARFLKEDVKAFIDSRYRTATGQSILLGTGKYGGLALITVLKFPSVFSRAGIFSPENGLLELLNKNNLNGKGFSGMLFFFYPDSDSVDRIADRLAAESSALLYTTNHQNPRRRKSALGGWYAEFYKWITGNGFNYIIRPPRR